MRDIDQKHNLQYILGLQIFQVELLKATVTHSVLCVLFFSLWIDLDMLLDW